MGILEFLLLYSRIIGLYRNKAQYLPRTEKDNLVLHGKVWGQESNLCNNVTGTWYALADSQEPQVIISY